MNLREAEEYKHLFILVEDPNIKPNLQENAYRAFGVCEATKAAEPLVKALDKIASDPFYADVTSIFVREVLSTYRREHLGEDK